MIEYLLISEDDGVFIGEMLGLGFWSKLDSVGIGEAVTFPSEDSIEEYLATWAEYPKERDKLSFVPVEIANKGKATMEECIAVGIEAWKAECPNDEIDIELNEE